MNTAQKLLSLTAQLLDSPGLLVEDLDDLKVLAQCGLPLQARRGLVRLEPLHISGTPLDLEETLAATLALLLTQPTPRKPIQRSKSSYAPAAAATQRNDTAPS